MTKKRYEITIVVPIYNVEKYLEECLESIVRQTFCPLEVLMIDDGSTDNSGKIAKKFEQQYGHFKYIYQENRGLAATRNLGISLALGEYICFIDSDDYVQMDYLEKLYVAINDYHAEMVIADFHEVDERGERVAEGYGDSIYQKGLVDKEKFMHALTITGKCHYAIAVIVAWNKLVKTDIMKKIHYPEGVNHEDEFAIMQLLVACDKIVWLSDDLYAYRQRKNSIMSTINFSTKYFKVIDAYEDRIRLCREYNLLNMQDDFIKALFENITIQYAVMRSKFNEKRNEMRKFYFKRMTKALGKYGLSLDRKDLIKYLIFIFAPEYYIRRFLGVK